MLTSIITEKKSYCCFPVGIGKSKCVCGAVSGGVMALGYFFGRTKGGDPKVQNTLELANELQVVKEPINCAGKDH
jgi:C_GCAxxG_C_C family probable redox protein